MNREKFDRIHKGVTEIAIAFLIPALLITIFWDKPIVGGVALGVVWICFLIDINK